MPINKHSCMTLSLQKSPMLNNSFMSLCYKNINLNPKNIYKTSLKSKKNRSVNCLRKRKKMYQMMKDKGLQMYQSIRK